VFERDCVLIDAKEFTKLTNLSYRTLLRASQRGELHPMKFGASTRWSLDEVLAWIEDHAQQSQGAPA